MNLLITGGSGLLGSNLALESKRNGYNVTTTHHQNSSPPSIESYQIDLTIPQAVSNLIHKIKPNYIVHCAAQTNVDWCENHPQEAFKINAQTSHHIAQAANRIAAKLVYISTDAVYDGIHGNYTECAKTNPVNVYAASKLAGEEAVLEETGNNALILRTNIYGWNRQNKSSLAEWILTTLSSKQTMRGFSDVTFSPLLVNDLASLIFKLIRSNATGCFNTASANSCSKYDFAKYLADTFSLSPELIEKSNIASANLQAPRPQNTSLNVDKLSQTIGYKPPTILSGLHHFKNLQNTPFLKRLKAVS